MSCLVDPSPSATFPFWDILVPLAELGASLTWFTRPGSPPNVVPKLQIAVVSQVEAGPEPMELLRALFEVISRSFVDPMNLWGYAYN